MPGKQGQPLVSSANAVDHIRWIRSRLEMLAETARNDVVHVDEPRAEALLETTAEVLYGLSKAYADYEKKDEPAWR